MSLAHDFVQSMYSADHYQIEVNTNMSDLAEILQSVQDNIFTVQFQTKPNVEDTVKALMAHKDEQLNDPRKISKLAKQIVTGNLVKMVCHLVKIESNVGRSLVIDLTATSENKIQLIDHRSVEFIVYHNVKYNLQKGARFLNLYKNEFKSEPKWDKNSLRVGNWFSGTRYLQAILTKSDDEVLCEPLD